MPKLSSCCRYQNYSYNKFKLLNLPMGNFWKSRMQLLHVTLNSGFQWQGKNKKTLCHYPKCYFRFFRTRMPGQVIFSTALSRQHVEVFKMTSIEHAQSARISIIIVASSGARVEKCYTSLIIFIPATKYRRVNYY